MGWSCWTAPWAFAPIMMAIMLVCIAGMVFMMRRMRGYRHRDPVGAGMGGLDLTRAGPDVPARSADRHSAFEEYRAEALRRLDREQAQFRDFLDRLRTAKDKAEFEKFMDERRGRPASSARAD